MRVVICGAGIAGLALAGRLHNTLGWDVIVLEKAPRPRTEGCMIDFFGPGYDAAEAMGVLPSLEELSHRVSEAVLVDECGDRLAGLCYDRFARSLGGRLLSIMRPDLELALRERLSLAVRLRFGSGPSRIEARADGVRVILTDGDSIDADLLVGADGVHSTVRALVFGEEARYVHHLGYHTASFTFDDPETHAEVGDRFCLTDTVGRQLGLYALRGDTVAVVAAYRATETRPPGDARAALRHEYGTLGWLVPRVLANCPPPCRMYHDHVAQTVLPSWSHGRVVLVGDACQAVSPLAGQSASLAVGAAYVLADQLACASRIEDALYGYERLWRPVVTREQRAARRAARWFVPASPRRLRVRRAALRICGLPGAPLLFGNPLVGRQGPPLSRLASIPSWVTEKRGPGTAREGAVRRSPWNALRGG
ncbi:FAD-dependent monooxygenase [Streptomyces sp. NPDC014983]|uniref:FAD-dependent monooxygenase n=1 Tax=Streptomyces sp. NPDC014983 TaxID=3364933 RepID=UPI0036F96BF0